jgi:hypothetical protein
MEVSSTVIAGKPSRTLSSLGFYLLRQALVLLLIIIVGVHIMVLIANLEGSLNKTVRSQVNRQLRWMERDGELDDVRPELLPGAKN